MKFFFRRCLSIGMLVWLQNKIFAWLLLLLGKKALGLLLLLVPNAGQYSTALS